MLLSNAVVIFIGSLPTKVEFSESGVVDLQHYQPSEILEDGLESTLGLYSGAF